jgi:hypothetical protein
MVGAEGRRPSMSLTVLSPIQNAVVDRLTLATRLTTLEGKTLGLYSNGKLNARRM